MKLWNFLPYQLRQVTKIIIFKVKDIKILWICDTEWPNYFLKPEMSNFQILL